MLDAAKEPAHPLDILALLIRHAPAYGVTAKNDSEWDALFDSYVQALLGLPLAVIDDAFLRWNRGEGHTDLRMAGFYPKAPQLVILAEKSKTALYMAAYRARKALEWRAPQERPKLSIEERKAMGEQMRELASRLGGKPMPSVSPTRTPQQVAAELRARADAVGDVI